MQRISFQRTLSFTFLVVLLAGWFALTGPVSHSYAATHQPHHLSRMIGDDDPTPEGIRDAFKSYVQKWSAPLAVIGIILALVAFLVVPLLPEWAMTMKGYIVRALVILAAIAFMPSIVTAVSSIGKGTAPQFVVLFTPAVAYAEAGYRRWCCWYQQQMAKRRIVSLFR